MLKLKSKSIWIAFVMSIVAATCIGFAVQSSNGKAALEQIHKQPTIESTSAPGTVQVKQECKLDPALFDQSTVTVLAYSKTSTSPDGWGTGFITHGKNGETFVWTAAHVLSDTRSDRGKFDGKAEIMFVERNKLGRIVGKKIYACKMLRYSHHPDHKDSSLGEDLAILLVLKERLGTPVKLCCKDELPKLGSVVWHAGTMTGKEGGLTVSQGRIGQQYLNILGKGFYQINIMALQGSSGGPIFDQDGNILAMLTRGRGDMFNATVPHWRMREWADRVNATWAYDSSRVMPKLAGNLGDVEESYSLTLTDVLREGKNSDQEIEYFNYKGTCR